jgi:Ser/Thr protein kinase RdoA (MazF antagonist)
MLSELTETTFAPDTTRAVLAQVCHQVGLDPSDAVLLRHQTNAVYLLPASQIVVKIARPSERLEHLDRTLALVRWLISQNMPAVPPSPHEQPQQAAGCWATFWPYISQQDHAPVSAGDLGAPLRNLHSLVPPFDLPPLDTVAAIQQSLAASRILSDEEREFLTSYCTDLAAAFPSITYELPVGLIHEDPQHHNALLTPQGTALIDWDGACIGPREWDLTTIEIHCRRFFPDPAEYTRFVDVYGYDVREWLGYPILRDLRELRMIATNARKSPPGSPPAGEVHSRVSQLRAGERGTLWRRL